MPNDITIPLEQPDFLETKSNKFNPLIFAKAGEALKSTEESFFKSSNFSPSFKYPYNPDYLSEGNNYDTYDEMRQDDQIKACLAIKKNMVVGSGWEVEGDDDEVCEFVRKEINNLDDKGLEPSFDSVMLDILTAFDYGFSLSEIVYRVGKDDKLIHLDKIKTRPPHTFEFEIDDFANVLKIKQNTAKGPLDFDPNIFLDYVYQQEYGQPYGVSDLQAAYVAWKSKKFFMRMYPIYVEKFASPTIIGEYEKSWGDQEIQRFFDILKKIQSNSVAMKPKDGGIEFAQLERDASDVYINGINLYNTMIARSLLIPDLIGLSGEKTGGGSYALGQKQFGLFMNLIAKERKTLENKITRKVIDPLIKANFGEDKECKFKFLPFSSGDELEFAKLWVSAISGKAWEASIEEINTFRKITGFPISETVIRPQPAQTQFNPSGNSDDKKENEPAKKEGGDSEQKIDDIKKGEDDKEEFALKLTRQKTPYEKKINFARAIEIMDDDDSEITKPLNTAAGKIINSFIGLIEAKGIIRNFQPEKINAIKPEELVGLKEMNIVLKRHYKGVAQDAVSAAAEELAIPAPKKYADAREETSILPSEFIKLLEAETFKNVGDYAIKITQKGKAILAKGMRDGLGESALVNLIREEVKGTSEQFLNALVRTKNTDIYNKARKTFYDTDPQAKSLIDAYQFSAILDDRTSDICRSLDGKVFSADSDYCNRICPPVHINCRSLLVPITRFEDYKIDKEIPLEKLQDKGGGLIL